MSIPVTEAQKYSDGGESVVYMPEQILSRKATEYDKHDKKRSEIIYFENIIFKCQYVYSNYMDKFDELKSKAQDPRNVVYPFVNYIGSQIDNIAYKKYMKIINLSEGDMTLESF